jgi:hypothetical protein
MAHVRPIDWKLYADMRPIIASRILEGTKPDVSWENLATPDGSDRIPAPKMHLARLNIDEEILDDPKVAVPASLVSWTLFSDRPALAPAVAAEGIVAVGCLWGGDRSLGPRKLMAFDRSKATRRAIGSNADVCRISTNESATSRVNLRHGPLQN